MSIPEAQTNWAGGYVTDVAYLDSHFSDLAPVHLNYVALLNHCAPRTLGRRFRYLELGCGNGHTITVLAAANPEAQFYACDFNPMHVAKAREWADAAGLKNLTILEASFQELTALELPEFDFIAFHGIYSWVSEANRKAIGDVIARRLLPGGLVYNSYNCLPGWAPQTPVQRLMLEMSRDIPGDSLQKARGAFEYLQQLTKCECRYLESNPVVTRFIENLAYRSVSYVAHEFLNSEWHPFYCLDVFHEMGLADLSFVGSAQAYENHPHLLFQQAARALFDAQSTPERKQLTKDILLNQRFRCDVYGKGVSALSPADARAQFREMSVGLMKPAAEVSYSMKCPAGELQFGHALGRGIVSALSKGALTVGELAALPKFARISDERLQKAVHTLISAGQVVPFAAPAPKVAEQTGKLSVPLALNRQVLAHALEKKARGVLASTIAGRGVPINLYDRCFTHELVAGDAANVPEAVLVKIENHGLGVKRGNEVLMDREAGLAELQKKFDAYKAAVLPMLIQLGIVEAASAS
jgi:SAM-dependent methyltransferase